MTDRIWLPLIDQSTCTGCSDCVTACPTHALALVAGVAEVHEPAACNYCGICEMICPVEAVALPYQVVLSADL
jgi:MinD superfamily P-loop ATPase